MSYQGSIELCPRGCTLEPWSGTMNLEDGTKRVVGSALRCAEHGRNYSVRALVELSCQSDRDVDWSRDSTAFPPVGKTKGWHKQPSGPNGTKLAPLTWPKMRNQGAPRLPEIDNALPQLARPALTTPEWRILLESRERVAARERPPIGDTKVTQLPPAKRAGGKWVRDHGRARAPHDGPDGFTIISPPPEKRPVGRPRRTVKPDGFAVKTARMELERIAERSVSTFQTGAGRPRTDDMQRREDRRAFALSVYVLVATGSRRKVLSLALGCGTTTIDTLYNEGKVIRAVMPPSSTSKRYVRFSDFAHLISKTSPEREEEDSRPVESAPNRGG